MDDSLFLNFFNYPENINLQIYQMLFSLFIKELISKDTLDKIRDKFVEMKEYEKRLREIEKRCIFKKIELDRHFMKKERAQHEKVTDYNVEKKMLFGKATPIGRSDLVDVVGVNMNPKIVFLVDLTSFFTLNRKYDIENELFLKIDYVSKNYFQKPERSNVFLSSLDVSLCTIPENKNVKRQKKEDKTGDQTHWADFLIKNYNHLLKKEKKSELVNYLNVKSAQKFHNLRRAVQLLKEKGYSIYFTSEASLKHFLSELVVFGVDYIDLQNVISYKYHRIDDICIKIREKEGFDQIFLLGSLTNVDRDYLYLVNKIEKLNEIAVRISEPLPSMIFSYAVDSLDETTFTIQKSLTEISEIKQGESASQEIVDNINNFLNDPLLLSENMPVINRALIKLHKNKTKIITRYDQILKFLDDQLQVFDDELERCKETFAISALKIRASNIDTALNDEDDGRYCICNVKNKGDMVACDADDCPIEWFHLECVGLNEPPKGKWICDDCKKNENK